jgi:hypothetical protein
MIRRIRHFDGVENERKKTLFRKSINKLIRRFLGDLSGEGTPGPISNPAVKLTSADGTWGVTPWESRSSPRAFFIFIEIRDWRLEIRNNL